VLDDDCGPEPNVLCLPVTDVQQIGFACECVTSTTTTFPGFPSGAFMNRHEPVW
jgi:hypothetical protein